MRMIDNNDADDKIIAVAADDVSVNHLDNINALPPHFKIELKHFFEQYNRIENKIVLVEEIQDVTVAKAILVESVKRYIAN